MSPNLRLKVSKPRLKKLLEFASIDSELDMIRLKYDGGGLTQSQLDPSYTLAVVSRFSKAYFTEMEVAGEGEVILPTTIYDIVNKYFKEIENIEVIVAEGRIVLKGKDETYEGGLMQAELPRIETQIEEREYGYTIPVQVMGVYGIDSEDWQIRADKMTIHYGDTLKLTVELEGGGVYTRTIKVLDKRDVKGSGHVVVDGKTLRKVIGMFSGPLYLVVTEGPIILTQKTSEYAVGFVIAPMTE